jgi:hypothetical protein
MVCPLSSLADFYRFPLKQSSMDSILKREWLKALRSGEYKQGHATLRHIDDTYCCLGVLCDVSIKLAGLGEWKKVHTAYETVWQFVSQVDTSDCDGSETMPNHSLAMVFELDEEDWAEKLASMNDEGKSFDEIAQVIEEKING